MHEAEAGVKLEILTPDKIKTKALKGMYFHQEITKTSTRNNSQNNSEKYDQKKRNIFLNGRTTSEKFEAIVIATNGDNRNVRNAEQEDDEVHIMPETQFSQSNKGKLVPVSIEMNNIFQYG